MTSVAYAYMWPTVFFTWVIPVEMNFSGVCSWRGNVFLSPVRQTSSHKLCADDFMGWLASHSKKYSLSSLHAHKRMQCLDTLVKGLDALLYSYVPFYHIHRPLSLVYSTPMKQLKVGFWVYRLADLTAGPAPTCHMQISLLLFSLPWLFFGYLQWMCSYGCIAGTSGTQLLGRAHLTGPLQKLLYLYHFPLLETGCCCCLEC